MDSHKNIPNSAGSSASDYPQTLRDRATERFRSMDNQDLQTLRSEETKRLVHELRVHQIELEIQNEDLRRAQEELDAARACYFDLYDFAPVGYMSVSEAGLIVKANLTAATLLGVPRAALLRQPLTRFILPEDQDIYYQQRKKLYSLHLESSEQRAEARACKLRVVKEDDGTVFWVCLEATVRRNIGNTLEFRVVLSNITKLKETEEALRKALQDEIKTLRGIITICANCKNVRDDHGFWSQVEVYIREHTEAVFTHGLCPDCATKLYPDVDFGSLLLEKKKSQP